MSTARSFLQTTTWMNFQRTLGREVFEYNENNISAKVIKYRLPFGRSYLYIPHGPEFDLNAMTGGFKNPIATFVHWLRALADPPAGGRKAIFIKAEPLADSIAQLLVSEGKFRQSKKAIQPAKTIIIELDKDESELLGAMHHKTRYNIKVAEKHGVTVAASNDSEGFWKLMGKTTARDKFSPHPRAYYQKLLEQIHGSEMYTKLFIAEQGETLIAAAIVLIYGDTGYYLHGASDYDYHALMAPYKLHWEIIQYLKTHGLQKYDLWGIDARQWPGVTRFKLGWGGQTVEYPGAFDLVLSCPWYLVYKFARKFS